MYHASAKKKKNLLLRSKISQYCIKFKNNTKDWNLGTIWAFNEKERLKSIKSQ